MVLVSLSLALDSVTYLSQVSAYSLSLYYYTIYTIYTIYKENKELALVSSHYVPDKGKMVFLPD